MDQEQILKLAAEAKCPVRGHYDEPGCTPQELSRFATLVAAAEREACAKVCDGVNRDGNWFAAAIRARSNQHT